MSVLSDLAAGRSNDEIVDREMLRYAVARRITCPQTGRLLDVRTAVYVRITSQSGATGSEVVHHEAWDGTYGEMIRMAAETGRVEISELLDGRTLYA